MLSVNWTGIYFQSKCNDCLFQSLQLFTITPTSKPTEILLAHGTHIKRLFSYLNKTGDRSNSKPVTGVKYCSECKKSMLENTNNAEKIQNSHIINDLNIMNSTCKLQFEVSNFYFPIFCIPKHKFQYIFTELMRFLT